MGDAKTPEKEKTAAPGTPLTLEERLREMRKENESSSSSWQQEYQRTKLKERIAKVIVALTTACWPLFTAVGSMHQCRWVEREDSSDPHYVLALLAVP